MLGEYDAGYEHYIDSLIREAEWLQADNDKLREENERFVIKLNAEHVVRQNAESENAKLREEIDRLIQAIEDLHDVSLEDRLVQLENENSKLRDLVQELWEGY